MDYISVKVKTTSGEADIVSLVLIEEGSEGTCIDDPTDLDSLKKDGVIWDYIDENAVKPGDNVFVTGFFDADYDVKPLLERLSGNEVSINKLHSNDYENEWKKYYKPIVIGHLAVVPSWLEYDGNETKIYIEPGKAFGTGSHETTSMCLDLIQLADIKDKDVCDAGCGSGILGIAALKLGAKSCIMADVDIQAVEAAKLNAQLNAVGAEIIHGGLDFDFSVDIVIANLTVDILVDNKKSLIEGLKAGGKLIISGIIDTREHEIESAFSSLKQLKHKTAGDWHAYLYEKNIR